MSTIRRIVGHSLVLIIISLGVLEFIFSFDLTWLGIIVMVRGEFDLGLMVDLFQLLVRFDCTILMMIMITLWLL